MSIKISQLPLETSVSGATIVPIVDPSGPTSYQTTLANINTYLTTQLPTGTNSSLGLVQVDGTTITVNNGIISATPPQSTVIHAFKFDTNNNLIYTQTTGQSFNYTADGVNSSYAMVDIGTNIYSYSLDANGNLIATFSS
jgi:hypothetical protein